MTTQKTARLGPFVLALSVAALVTGVAQAVDRPAGTNYTPPAGPRTISVVPASTAQELLQCLVGPDVTILSATLTTAAGAAGTFSGALGVIGFDQGIILSSGNIATLVGPNTVDNATTQNGLPGDPDLDNLIPGFTTYDATILEFRFSCESSQNVSFQYVFGSEEYNEWVDSDYNDVFGFFLNGVNIADVPAVCSNPNIPVAINNVNCGNPYVGSGPNCDCYRNNDLDDGGGAIDSEMDGLTQVFFATAAINPGINSIKIAIADAGDDVLDSNVMIRCESFTCAAPPPVGACCLSSGACITLTYDDCSLQGGSYYGDLVPCVPNPCAQPTGACCFSTGTCQVTGEAGCLQNGGIYYGDGIPCEPNPCPLVPVDETSWGRIKSDYR